MAQEVKVTADEFRKLENPYTGKPMDVYMLVGAGPVPLFHCGPDEYRTQSPFETAELAKLAWSRKDGVEGGRSGPVVCAYTGEPLSADATPDGFAFSGGFDPRVLRSREWFLHFAAMRGGVSPYPRPESAPSRVEKVVRVETPAKRKNAVRGAQLSDEAVDLAASAMPHLLNSPSDERPRGPP